MAKEMLTVIHFLLDLTLTQTMRWDLVVIVEEELMVVLSVSLEWVYRVYTFLFKMLDHLMT